MPVKQRGSTFVEARKIKACPSGVFSGMGEPVGWVLTQQYNRHSEGIARRILENFS